MAEYDLKKLNRKELLELLIKLKAENDSLRQSLEEKEEELRKREVRTEDAETLTNAALELNGIFENAGKAAAEYLKKILDYNLYQRTVSEKIITDAEEKAESIIDEAQQKARTITGEVETEDYSINADETETGEE